MSKRQDRSAETAVVLRREFDRSFAEAVRPKFEAFEDLVAVRIAGDPHVFRLSEITGLYVDREVVPIPSPAPEFLGIAGFRNTMAPVYDLQVLLGYPGGSAPRWLVLAHALQPVALAFDLFEGHLRVPRERVSSIAEDDSVRQHVRGAAQTDLVRPIIHIASLLEAIAGRVLPQGEPKER